MAIISLKFFNGVWIKIGSGIHFKSQHLFKKEFEVLREVYNKSELPNLPGHNEDTNQNAPLGGGVLLLVGFGVVYARKKRRE